MNTLAVKLYPETEELFLKIFEESDCKTRDQFISLLLENYQNPRKVEVPKPEDAERIQALTVQVDELKSLNVQLTSENDALSGKLGETIMKLNQAGIIPDGMVLFPITSQEQEYIKNIKAQIKETHGQDVTDAEILEYMIKKRLINR